MLGERLGRRILVWPSRGEQSVKRLQKIDEDGVVRGERPYLTPTVGENSAIGESKRRLRAFFS